ncbi:MAG: lipoate--protein ligase [Eubacteriaceae bacterium]|nr:lipoate--protein ligase [Eubacteriaceae bacterium]
MQFLHTDWDIPYYNMALEDYLMNEPDSGDFIFFYIHKPSVMVGSHQNTYNEINYPYIEKNGIYVARRISGGGAVYHDYGNLNYSYIVSGNNRQGIDFEPFTSPIINALRGLGVNAELSGRNDMLVGSKKFSGNAQYIKKDRVLSHGTLMFDVSIENMVSALNPDAEKFKGKAIASVRSRVANLKGYISQEIDIYEFKAYLASFLIAESNAQQRKLTRAETDAVEKSVAEKFSTWEHNFGQSPSFAVNKKMRFGAGTISVGINAEGGVISSCKFSGDFFSDRPVAELESLLAGMELRYGAIEAIAPALIPIAGLSPKELAELLLS